MPGTVANGVVMGGDMREAQQCTGRMVRAKRWALGKCRGGRAPSHLELLLGEDNSSCPGDDRMKNINFRIHIWSKFYVPARKAESHTSRRGEIT